MTHFPGDSDGKRKEGGLRKVAKRNLFFDHPSPKQRKTLPAIPLITTILVFQDRPSPISQEKAAMPT